jgi:serine/threonine protein kinase
MYLHGRNIVHGDLKSVDPVSLVNLHLSDILLLQLNVLIDDGENAVLCDFDLSGMKADVAGRTVRQTPTTVTGSRNWIAPERLKGGSLETPCDIYSFGMMIYEVSAFVASDPG